MESQGIERIDSDAKLAEAIESIYACIIDAAGFYRLPSKLAPALHTRNVTVWFVDTDVAPVVVSNHRDSEGRRYASIDEWIRDDPLVPVAFQSMLAPGVIPEGVIDEREAQSLSLGGLQRTTSDSVQSIEGLDVIGSSWLAGLVAARGRAGPAICDDDRTRMRTLFTHIRRAALISLRMGLLSKRAEAAETLLSYCGLAIWLLDSNNRIYATNAVAKQMALSRKSDLIKGHEPLRFDDPELDSAFRTAVRRVEADQRAPAELSLPIGDERALRWGALLPIERAPQNTGADQTMYLLVLAQGAADSGVDWHHLKQRLPISPAEADVLARLMRAEDPPAIAYARGSTFETIRGYEKSLRTKLGCRSRAQLVACGWRAVAMIPFVGQDVIS